MNVDAAQYAAISSQMAETNSYLEVKEFDKDYLDKPPLLFWLSGICIKLFGINNFGYKIASFIFIMFSLYAVYRFALLYYNEKIANNALLILASTQAYFLITNDVRTDGLLASCVIGSVWLFSEYFVFRKIKFIILGSIFIALAMMTKGPIGMIAVLMPIGINLMYLNKWRDVFNLRWLIVLLIVAVLLLPMSYGLYTQFDLHPEKITKGVKGQSGLYFYYWLQSFGRITGENVWNNGLPWHFFLGSSLWDYFPWILPLYFGLFFKLKNIFVNKIKQPEIITLAGLIGLFALLSLSKYKLPHYVFVCFPFASVIAAQYLTEISLKGLKIWKKINYIFGILILILITIYPILFFNEFNLWLLVAFLLQLAVLYFFRKPIENNTAELLTLVIVFNFFLSFVFYPKLLSFQSDSVAGKWANDNIKNETVYVLNTKSYPFHYYTKNEAKKLKSIGLISKIKNPFWLYVSEEDLKEINKENVKITDKVRFDSYRITKLKLPFLLASSRASELKNCYLIKIENY